MKTLITKSALILIASTVPCFALDARDDADSAPYTDGTVAAGENGGNGFSAWETAILAGTFTSEDATNQGGDALMNTGSNRAFVLHAASVGAGAYVTAGRPFSGFTVTAGTVFQFSLEAAQTGSPATFSNTARLAMNSSYAIYTEVITVQGISTWYISDSVNTDTTIPATSPVVVTITWNSTSSYDIQVNEIGGSGSYSATSRSPLNTGTPYGYLFEARNSTVSGTVTTFVNNLGTDTTGSLPVELDYFLVE